MQVKYGSDSIDLYYSDAKYSISHQKTTVGSCPGQSVQYKMPELSLQHFPYVGVLFWKPRVLERMCKSYKGFFWACIFCIHHCNYVHFFRDTAARYIFCAFPGSILFSIANNSSKIYLVSQHVCSILQRERDIRREISLGRTGKILYTTSIPKSLPWTFSSLQKSSQKSDS